VVKPLSGTIDLFKVSRDERESTRSDAGENLGWNNVGDTDGFEQVSSRREVVGERVEEGEDPMFIRAGRSGSIRYMLQ
jgi:hypothetical protein